MIIAMGHSSALGVAVSPAAAAPVTALDSPGRSSLDCVCTGHGFRAAAPLVAIKGKLEPLPTAVTGRSSRRWRRELSLLGTRKTKDVRVWASSSDETTGEKVEANAGNVPGWAKPNSDELPPWAKNERPASQEPPQEASFAVYLLGSSLVTIAAVGSVFEYFNKNPVFGVIPPDSPFYAPILGFFAITGLPTAGFLFYKSIQLANKASEEADKEDGFPR